MPLKSHPNCLKCDANESTLWTNVDSLGVLCLNCVTETKNTLKAEQNEEEETQQQQQHAPKLRPLRSIRTCRQRFSGGPAYNETSCNGLVGSGHASNGSAGGGAINSASSQSKMGVSGRIRGRRALLFKNASKRRPMRASRAVATPITSNYVFHRGSYLQIGDIVSLHDDENSVYYAQIKGFLTDQYCTKSATITWLLPTKDSPPAEDGFDPASYIIGPEEEVPRRLDCMQFVMHAPSDYYQCTSTPYPPVVVPRNSGYIWSTLDTIAKFSNLLQRS